MLSCSSILVQLLLDFLVLVLYPNAVGKELLFLLPYLAIRCLKWSDFVYYIVRL